MKRNILMFILVFVASWGYSQSLYDRVGDIVKGKMVDYRVSADKVNDHVSKVSIIVENENNQDTDRIKPLQVSCLGLDFLIWERLTSEDVARVLSNDIPLLSTYFILDSFGNVKEVSFRIYKNDIFWSSFPPDRFYSMEQVIKKNFIFFNISYKRLVQIVNCRCFEEIEDKMIELDSIATVLLPGKRVRDSTWASLLKRKVESGTFEMDIPGAGIVVCRHPRTGTDSLVSGKTEPGFLCVSGDSIHSCLDRDFFQMKYGLGDFIPPFGDVPPCFTYPITDYRVVENDLGGYNVSYVSVKPESIKEGLFYKDSYWLRIFPDGKVYVESSYGGPYVGIIRE